MNMAVWAATQAAWDLGWRVLGVREGFTGLLRGDFLELNPAETLRYARLGGTFLGTSREPDFSAKVPRAVARLEEAGATHLLVLGGNGSLAGAAKLAEAGFPVVGIPCTIDNDVAGSEESIGFDTALNFALFVLDGMRDTAEALPRLFALETLGGDTGFLAAAVYAAGGGDALLVPEEPLGLDGIAAGLREALERQRYAVVVASEGYPDLLGVLGGLEETLSLRLRPTRLGHAQRGGRPSGHDRLLARGLAQRAVKALTWGEAGVLGVWDGRYRLLPYRDLAPRKPWTPGAWGVAR
jgi:6-phosphofructokinase 1